jgi:aldose 1-epimerase
MTAQGRTTRSGPRRVGSHRGAEVHEVTLTAEGGLQAQILTFGAVIRDLSLPLAAGERRSLVLGFQNFDPYPAHSPYFGALVGRYANRIAGGRFTLEGHTHLLDRNEAGTTTLHGGRSGFATQVWDIVDHSDRHVTLGLISPDGDHGFPGMLQVTCRYTVTPDNRLELALRARTDRPTPVNLTQHSYFNLDGGPDLSDHLLSVNADSFTPVAQYKIPTGEILSMAGTAFDLRQTRRLGDMAVALDHNFVLRSAPVGPSRMRPVAELTSPRANLRLHVTTTKLVVQIYDGPILDLPLPGLGGKRFGAKADLSIDTQFFQKARTSRSFPTRPIMRNSIMITEPSLLLNRFDRALVSCECRNDLIFKLLTQVPKFIN